jgi:UDP-N-acetylglucosamine 4,6-dehydratase/5-epimerase
MMNHLSKNDQVLLTGGTGSLGQALIPEILATGASLRVLSRDEAKQETLRAQYPAVDEWMLGDVRDLGACKKAVEGATVILHAASLKYVDRSEVEPTEYVLTNVLGTINLLRAVRERRAREARPRVVGISTDKACLPINAYGLTKALLEKLFLEASADSQATYVVCRYGNVVGSRGSVVLKWQAALRQGDQLRVTDPTMTRFFFTLADAVNVIDRALDPRSGLTWSGLVLSTVMPAATLGDLAQAMSPRPYLVSGPRPGEKHDEDLFSPQEMRRVSTDGAIFVYNPSGLPANGADMAGYTSAGARRLTPDELVALVAPWR